MVKIPFVRQMSMMAAAVSMCAADDATAQSARAQITEERRTIDTYPFSEPNPIPILGRDERLYPYHSFAGYAHTSEPQEWTVVHLENEWIEVWVLPEVGGKVWGARVKESGHEFIYRNEVMKFRNIALRGPWTSGGIEFNFGVVGHTPSTATPVDYVTHENDDGSVSVVVGTMDLPSRTNWRVEIRLPADAAYFETRALWNNPTTLEQPYYNWMTAAAFAQDDLQMSIPGTAYLEHPGGFQTWPQDAAGRDLSVYDQNRFGGNKSFHVVGEVDDFFGGYFGQADYGFGHWARYEEMPGQKLWLWALSRQGGIWEDLLTDTDGQYVEYQAGRLLVQYTPTGAVNPISQVGFEPGRTDRWTESWFPLEGLGGLTDASQEGAMFVEREDGSLRVRVQALRSVEDTLRIRVDDVVVVEAPVSLAVLETIEERFGTDVSGGRAIAIPRGADVVVELPRLGLVYHSNPEARALDRPYQTAAGAVASIPEADRVVAEARELVRGRRLTEARPLYERVLRAEPWHRGALLGLADLEYRRARFEEGLDVAERLLQLDAYDAEHNFLAGNLYRALGRSRDAREAYGWAARSTGFRSVSYVQLAELALADKDLESAQHYGGLALDYDRYNLSALQLLATTARLRGSVAESTRLHARLLEIDPLHHFVAAERYLASEDPADGRAFVQSLRSEMPEQEVLELATTYERRGLRADARALVGLGHAAFEHSLLRAWAAWLDNDDTALAGGGDTHLIFPYRSETLDVLQWAANADADWSWHYLLAMNLWGKDRADEAMVILSGLDDRPEVGVFYTARASLAAAVGDSSSDVERDLRRAVALDPAERTLRPPLIQFLQNEGRWEDAIAVTTEARSRFPGDFNLELLHAQALNETGRYEESIEILANIAVLPSEHAAMSHGLFANAHSMAALAVMDGDPEAAAAHLRTALTWPERLGLGRPYEPEERLQLYLLGIAARYAGDTDVARAGFEDVVTGTPGATLDGSGASTDRLDLLGAAALMWLGRADELRRFGAGSDGAFGRVAEVVRAYSSSVTAGRSGVPEAFAESLRRESELFSDVEGRLLYRALTDGGG